MPINASLIIYQRWTWSLPRLTLSKGLCSILHLACLEDAGRGSTWINHHIKIKKQGDVDTFDTAPSGLSAPGPAGLPGRLCSSEASLAGVAVTGPKDATIGSIANRMLRPPVLGFQFQISLESAMSKLREGKQSRPTSDNSHVSLVLDQFHPCRTSVSHRQEPLGLRGMGG